MKTKLFLLLLLPCLVYSQPRVVTYTLGTTTENITRNRFVTADGGYPSAGGIAFGVSLETILSGNSIRVATVGSPEVLTEEAITKGNFVSAGTSGKARVWRTGDAVLGKTENSASSGSLVTVFLSAFGGTSGWIQAGNVKGLVDSTKNAYDSLRVSTNGDTLIGYKAGTEKKRFVRGAGTQTHVDSSTHSDTAETLRGKTGFTVTSKGDTISSPMPNSTSGVGYVFDTDSGLTVDNGSRLFSLRNQHTPMFEIGNRGGIYMGKGNQGWLNNGSMDFYVLNAIHDVSLGDNQFAEIYVAEIDSLDYAQEYSWHVTMGNGNNVVDWIARDDANNVDIEAHLTLPTGKFSLLDEIKHRGFIFYPLQSNDTGKVAYLFDTRDTLDQANQRLASYRNGGVEKFGIGNDGTIYQNGSVSEIPTFGQTTSTTGDSVDVPIAGITVSSIPVVSYGEVTALTDKPAWAVPRTDTLSVHGTSGKLINYSVKP